MSVAKTEPNLGRDLLALTKPNLSLLVLVTAGGGLWLADAEVGWLTALAAMVGTTAVVAAANALNCYIERDGDRLMSRTANRPLPAGRLDPSAALGFGLFLAFTSVPLLTLLTTPLAGLLAAVALVLYVLVYTPLKRRSSSHTLIGAIPGAMPPLIGWAAATDTIAPGALLLFAILFAWQIPHSLAISLFREADYRRAGIVIFPIEHGAAATRSQILLYTLLLVPLPLALVWLGVGGAATAIGGSVLGLLFLRRAWNGYRRRLGPRWARSLFLYSLVYLSGLFAALALDTLLSSLL